jgi:hypothetical protein
MRNLDSLRQTPSVEEGITQRYVEDGVTVVCYEPGNGTRYVLTFTKVPDEACMLLAVSPGATIVADINHQVAYVFQPKGILHFNYVGHKMKRSEPDSIVIAELIGHVMKREAISCEEYTQRMLAAEAEAEAAT